MINAPVIWRPNPGPQTEFLADPCDWILYGGAAGGGKSDALLVDALGQVDDKAYQAILFRKSYPDLEELITRSHEIYPWCGAKWGKTEKTWRFPSGATIKFRYIERDEDARNYQGHQYQWIGFDELTHFTEWQWWYMRSRNRARAPGQRCYMRASCNPDGKGLHWVKGMFVDAITPGKVLVREILDPITDEVVKIRQRFIPAKLGDNPILARSGYGATLASLPEADRKALLDGDWNAYTGSVFRFEAGIHTWTWAQFRERTGNDGIPKEWTRYRLMDWGFAHPFAVYWVAVDYEGRGYVYREWYGVQGDGKGGIKADVGIRMEPTLAGEWIANVERQEAQDLGIEQAKLITTAWTGPDLNSAGTGDTSAGIKRSEYFAKAGIRFQSWEAGPDSRKAKKAALHERLRYERLPDGAIAEYPGLVLITEECPHAIRTIPALEYDPARGGEDIDTRMEDHPYDAISAFCLMRPWAPKVKTPPKQSWRGNRNRGGTGMVV